MTAPAFGPTLDVEALTEAVRLAFGPALLLMRPTMRGAAIVPQPAEMNPCAAEQAWCHCLASHVAGAVARHYQDQLADEVPPLMGRAWRPRRRGYR